MLNYKSIVLEYKSMPELLNDNTFQSIRLYGDKPSVTSVLKVLKDPSSLAEFKSAQPEEFEAMMQRKAAAGTRLHDTIEKTYKTGRFHFIDTEHSEARLKFRTSEGNRREAHSLEEKLIDEETGGRLDACMRIEGILSLVDWKSAGKQYYDELTFKYFMQLSRYVKMYNDKYGTDISGKIVFLPSTGKYKILDLPDREWFQAKYAEVYKVFIKKYTLYKEMEASLN